MSQRQPEPTATAAAPDDDRSPARRWQQARGTFAQDRRPLAVMAAMFAVLVLVGAALLIGGAQSEAGLLLSVVGAVQIFVCSAVLGVLIRRWREPLPYLELSGEGIKVAGRGLARWSDLADVAISANGDRCSLVLRFADPQRPEQRADLGPLSAADQLALAQLLRAGP